LIYLLIGVLVEKDISDDSSDEDYENKSTRSLSEEPMELFTLDNDGVELILDSPEPQKRKRLVKARSGPSVNIIHINDSDTDDQPETKKKKGPTSETRSYFQKPKAIIEKKKWKWLFSCKLCSR